MVRVRHVEDLAPEMVISQNQAWNVAAQLKMFLDEAGELWQQDELINKVVTAFTSSQTAHGGGNRYGASYTTVTRVGEPDEETRGVAIAQGGRLARVARVIANAQRRGLFDVRCTVVAEAESRVR